MQVMAIETAVLGREPSLPDTYPTHSARRRSASGSLSTSYFAAEDSTSARQHASAPIRTRRAMLPTYRVSPKPGSARTVDIGRYSRIGCSSNGRKTYRS
jgi:hypothetical protein